MNDEKIKGRGKANRKIFQNSKIDKTEKQGVLLDESGTLFLL